MATSDAATPLEYLASLAPDRADVIAAVRAMVNEELPEGFVETMGFGMITWVVPLEVCPDTYNGKPLMYAGLAAQKNYSALYLTGLYAGKAMTDEQFRARWSSPRRLDMGKSCIRFRAVDDLDLPLLREVVGACTLDGFVATSMAYHHRPRRR